MQDVTGPGRHATIVALGLVALLLISGEPCWAQESRTLPNRDSVNGAGADADRQQVAAQLANVKRLLEVSSGAERVRASNNQLAEEIRRDALDRHRRAEAAFGAGHYEEARRMLNESAQAMFQAVRMLGPAAEVAEKQVRDFEGREESTKALLEALRRISGEEGTESKVASTIGAVEKAVAMAREQMAAGKREDARKLLDGGYELAKVALEGLRDGKTLVRSLHFGSPEEEYRYELDRNDTHHMLVNVVLKDKPPTAQAVGMIDQSMQKAGTLRGQAERMAAEGQFQDAIRLLEESTKELVRAIRGAGLYIPG